MQFFFFDIRMYIVCIYIYVYLSILSERCIVCFVLYYFSYIVLNFHDEQEEDRDENFKKANHG